MTKAIIIEAGPGRRRLDPRQSEPRSLIPIEASIPSALHWIVRALEQNNITDITYVGGYHIEKVIQSFPKLSFRYMPDKGGEGELGALLSCEEPNEDCLILRATTVVMPTSLPMMVGDGVGVGIYHTGGIPKPVGLYAFGQDDVTPLFELARSLTQDNDNATMEDALQHFVTRQVVLDGMAVPASDRAAVAAMVLQGKAKTLENLAPLSKKSHVLALERFTVTQWQSDSEAILQRVCTRFSATPVVVRSSTVSEDSHTGSAAGQFLSVLDVDIQDAKAVTQAIEDVIVSYAEGGREIDLNDEILVQPYVRDLVVSGVLLTRDPQHGAPYFILNVDQESGRSDVVTSGGEGNIDTYYVSWCRENHSALELRYNQILEAGRELVALSHMDSLDIEFGIDASGLCHLFQVRPLSCVEPTGIDIDDDVIDVINHVYEFVREASRPRPGVLGNDNLMGNMSDWNPAEMIGAYPRPLALSLYQTLIGEWAWSKARARIGYRVMTSQPLILALAGRPYVDIRTSLNSFLPANLDEGISARWVDYCMAKLRADPPLHDKIEFELTVTCLTPEWNKHEQWMREAGLDEVERGQFHRCLADMTSAMVKGEVEPISQQYAAIEQLTARRDEILSTSSDNVAGMARQLRQLLLDCTALGLVPFSIVARYAFVAMSLLKGLRSVGAIDADLYDGFLHAIPTVSGKFAADAVRLMDGDLGMDEMVARYGHLRPHSYDITSSNYASRPEHYFQVVGNAPVHENQSTTDPVELLLSRKDAIQKAMASVGLDIDAKTLAEFMVDAITGREQIKFEFMKSVNAILETITKIGACISIDPEVLSFIPIEEFSRLEANSASRVLQSQIRRMSGHNEKHWLLAKTLRFPDLITDADDIFAHRLEAWRPNFVTRKTVTAAPLVLGDTDDPADLDGAIVLIRAADPGFDWIFGHPIAGLVTQYGGVASHMAIRAAEFGLPAAIGCGEELFDKLSRAKKVTLDCEHHRVEVEA